MFSTRTITEPLKALTKEEQRLIIATYLLSKMIDSGGLKVDKVRAAFEYADLLMNNGIEKG